MRTRPLGVGIRAVDLTTSWSHDPVPPIQAPAMRPSPFRAPAGGIWTDLYMAAEAGAVPRARRFAEAYLRHRHLTALSDTLTLVASELVTNAVRATEQTDLGQPIVAMRLRLTPASLFVEVWDRVPDPPVLTSADALDIGGRGLALVTALAKTWDHYPCDEGTAGKVVWAEIATEPVTS
jgi:anti-sigma regulatory factor (Ser/Thr protein kinase)